MSLSCGLLGCEYQHFRGMYSLHLQLWNMHNHIKDYTVLQSRRPQFTSSQLRELQTSSWCFVVFCLCKPTQVLCNKEKIYSYNQEYFTVNTVNIRFIYTELFSGMQHSLFWYISTDVSAYSLHHPDDGGRKLHLRKQPPSYSTSWEPHISWSVCCVEEG
jgi:hypothetical protein